MKEVAPPPEVPIDQLTALLNELLKAATTAPTTTHCNFASSGMQLITRSLLSCSKPAELRTGTKHVSQTYKAALTDYMKRRNCRLTSKVFSDFIERRPAIAASAFGYELVSFGAAARSEFLRNDALRLASLLARQHLLIKPSLEGKKGTQLAAAVAKSITATVAADWSKSQRLREALTSCQQLTRLIIVHLGLSLPGHTELVGGVQALAEKELPAGVINAAKVLLKLLTGEEQEAVDIVKGSKKGKKKKADTPSTNNGESKKAKRRKVK